MSSAIVENDDNPTEVTIESRNGASVISMQAYQDLYNQITGKTEEVTKISKKSIRVNLDDIKQLDLKIKQILEQYRVISSNSSFTIFFEKDQKETHSSIERFLSLNSSTNGCTESIVARYNFAIILPQTNRAQNYSITIRLISRITTQRKLIEELPTGLPRSLLSMLSSKTCEIKVSYVDYVVARTITAVFDEWLEALDESKESKYLNFARKRSHFIPSIFKYSTLIACSFFVISLMPVLIGISPSTSQLASFFTLSLPFYFFCISNIDRTW
ncbi:hypothetical protein EJG51_003470 [Undibacterium piscinae]|uniref:Uncharacterized protein n=1 Tax=Undibacterium piscinae TaxID=2495591 RepID=A0A6M4A144_9BURK|nr:hypothetical protein EJG51_003470 [Undibacterium piscinae]